MAAGTTIANGFLRGQAKELAPELQRAVYGFLRQLLDHSKASTSDVQLLAPLLRQGMMSDVRSVRIEAG